MYSFDGDKLDVYSCEKCQKPNHLVCLARCIKCNWSILRTFEMYLNTKFITRRHDFVFQKEIEFL